MKTKRHIAAVLLLAALTMLAACQSNDPLVLEEPQEYIPTLEELEALQSQEQPVATRTAVVYFQDDAGYLVPVSCSVPLVEGVARQSLDLMVGGEVNDLNAARLGLYTLIPEGTLIDVDVSAEGLATVSLSKEARNCPDAVSENNMVTGIVQALTEYPSVEQVRILINGEEIAELPNGTDISGPLSRASLNLESVERGVSLTGAQSVMLYFESETAPAMVPVTRTVFSNPDIETALIETLKGPREGSELSTQIPKGTGLISVRKANGVVTINLSKEFLQVLEQADGGTAAVKALALACSQFPDVSEVKIQVEGKAFELDTPTMAAPFAVNSDAAISLTDIFEDE